MSTILKVQDMNVYYGAIHAIKGISFEVNEGEVVTLIGANGAGKTTTLQTISGLLRSKTGSIEFLGENISHVPAHKLVERGLVQVPEGRRIFLQMTVQENLDMGAFTAKGDSSAAMEQVFQQFPRLKERRKQIAGTLSGGEQQMLAMGRALMSRGASYVLPHEGDGSGLGAEQSGYGVKGGGLACAVGADQRHDLPFIYLKRYALDGVDGAVIDVDVFNF